MSAILTEGGLCAFIRQSNHIEGITRDFTLDEYRAHQDLLALAEVTVADLERFVQVVAPGMKLRTRSDMNVRVGSHVAPKGGPNILRELKHILSFNVFGGAHPWVVHRAYEVLHPFMDGNGRSGRALWLWQMVNQEHGDDYALTRGFLHTFYYQALANATRGVKPPETSGDARNASHASADRPGLGSQKTPPATNKEMEQ